MYIFLCCNNNSAELFFLSRLIYFIEKCGLNYASLVHLETKYNVIKKNERYNYIRIIKILEILLEMSN